MAEDETLAPPATTTTTPWFAVVLRQPLSTVQTLVGILAGMLTIVGAFFSMGSLTSAAMPPHQGEIVAAVQDARTRKPIAATVEILTPEDALVTTLNVEPDGSLTRRLKEGRYRLRVMHSAFSTEVRHIEVQAGQRSNVRIALGPRPRVVKTATVSEEPGPVKKFFKDLFGQ